MRRNQPVSPMPSDAPGGRENLARANTRYQVNDASGARPGETLADAARLREPAPYGPKRPAADMLRGAYVQLAMAAVVLTGLWVAISPWFLTLQTSLPGNARVNDLIIGLAVTVIGMLAIGTLRGLTGFPAVSLLAGIWLIISPFILDAKFSVTASMYWSNIWAGAIITVVSLYVLAAGQARAAR